MPGAPGNMIIISGCSMEFYDAFLLCLIYLHICQFPSRTEEIWRWILGRKFCSLIWLVHYQVPVYLQCLVFRFDRIAAMDDTVSFLHILWIQWWWTCNWICYCTVEVGGASKSLQLKIWVLETRKKEEKKNICTDDSWLDSIRVPWELEDR